jgi:hypothetical protein
VALYVLALTDTPLGSWTAGGRRLQTADYDGLHVIYERRAAPPPMDDAELRAQHGLVVAIAILARAVLPARFGSIIERRELTTLLRRHDVEIRAALALVRDRVQMTVRVLGAPGKRPAPPRGRPTSGRDYLERARLAASPPLPRQAQRFLSAVQPHVVSERREHGAGRLLATLYHLVDVRALSRYSKASGKRIPGVVISGPWPPFAFSPQLW